MAQYSGHYFFDFFSEEDKQKFKFNYESEQQELAELYEKDLTPFEQFLDDVYPSLVMFMAGAFIWNLSKEGFVYWSDLCDNLKDPSR